MKKTKNRTTGIFFYKLYMTLQIYLELYDANWIMKFKPQKVQDLISTMALELLKNIVPINWDKFCKITARLPNFFCVPELHTERISFIIFFVLGILMYFFFLIFL